MMVSHEAIFILHSITTDDPCARLPLRGCASSHARPQNGVLQEQYLLRPDGCPASGNRGVENGLWPEESGALVDAGVVSRRLAFQQR